MNPCLTCNIGLFFLKQFKTLAGIEIPPGLLIAISIFMRIPSQEILHEVRGEVPPAFRTSPFLNIPFDQCAISPVVS